jgi:hypothetical protein
MSFGLSVFAVIKLVQSMDDRWSRAKPGFRSMRKKSDNCELLVLSYLNDKLSDNDKKNLQKDLEAIVGLNNVIRIDDLFSGENFLKSACARFHCLLVNTNTSREESIYALLSRSEFLEVKRKTYFSRYAWNPEDKAFAFEIAGLVLECGAALIRDDWETKYPAPPSSS